MSSNETLLIGALIAEIQDLTSNVRALLKVLPHSEKVWLEPRELAAILTVSTKTLQLWRISGRFKPESYRRKTRGYQYHKAFALRDAQEYVGMP